MSFREGAHPLEIGKIYTLKISEMVSIFGALTGLSI